MERRSFKEDLIYPADLVQKLNVLFVDKAPRPVVKPFQRLHHWMVGLVKMSGGMFVFRGIAASHMTAYKTQPQMHPFVSYPKALLTAFCTRENRTNAVKVSANAGIDGRNVRDLGFKADPRFGGE